ncbi:MAG: hypothetical protein LBD02_05610 [Christensenellaceae bacterium]|nr:hypothetical protein [Christensenellaceae bacterium]
MLPIGLIKSKRDANTAAARITMPRMLLSGVSDHPHQPLQRPAGVPEPLHAHDLLPGPARAVVYAGSEECGNAMLFNPAVNLAAILAPTATCLALGAFFFAKSGKSR